MRERERNVCVFVVFVVFTFWRKWICFNTQICEHQRIRNPNTNPNTNTNIKWEIWLNEDWISLSLLLSWVELSCEVCGVEWKKRENLI
jgi:hypothetical protein